MPRLSGTPLPEPGETLAGRYRLVSQLGAGGMGRVYRAHDVLLGRDVAVKLFYADDSDDEGASRRIAEAKVLASLSHPSLVALYDAQSPRPTICSSSWS